VVIADKNVSDWIHTENLKFFGKNIMPERKAEVEHLGAPDISYHDAMIVRLGKREIYVAQLPGHTGGDSIVRIEDAKVTFWGDLFWHTTLPNLIDATTSEWSETLKPTGN